jgi:inward rectifier potassium channel
VQTFATIGYGAMFPKAAAAHWLVTVESLLGLFATAMVTGLVFARFARPTAKLLWSKVACISDREGTPTFMFRVANERMNFVADAHVRLALIREEFTTEGERIRKVHDLQLTRDTSPAFTLSWTVMHPITPSSPLYGCTRETLEKQTAQILITLTGLDETLMQTIYARHGYMPEDLRFGARFVDVIAPRASDGRVVLDYTKFDDVLPSPLSPEKLGLPSVALPSNPKEP